MCNAPAEHFLLVACDGRQGFEPRAHVERYGGEIAPVLLALGDAHAALGRLPIIIETRNGEAFVYEVSFLVHVGTA